MQLKKNQKIMIIVAVTLAVVAVVLYKTGWLAKAKNKVTSMLGQKSETPMPEAVPAGNSPTEMPQVA